MVKVGILLITFEQCTSLSALAALSRISGHCSMTSRGQSLELRNSQQKTLTRSVDVAMEHYTTVVVVDRLFRETAPLRFKAQIDAIENIQAELVSRIMVALVGYMSCNFMMRNDAGSVLLRCEGDKNDIWSNYALRYFYHFEASHWAEMGDGTALRIRVTFSGNKRCAPMVFVNARHVQDTGQVQLIRKAVERVVRHKNDTDRGHFLFILWAKLESGGMVSGSLMPDEMAEIEQRLRCLVPDKNIDENKDNSVSTNKISRLLPRHISHVKEAVAGRHGSRDVVFPLAEAVPPSMAGLSTVQVDRVSKETMYSLEFIAQVDNKFLLCRSSSEAALFLLDQHAADERCRLEHLLAELGASPNPTQLPDPYHMAIPDSLVSSLFTQADYLASWGCKFEYVTYNTLRVTHLPEVCVNRLSNQPKFIEQLIYEAVAPDRSYTDGCPRVLFDLLCSKACRGKLVLFRPARLIIQGAIMFNQSQTPRQCRDLLHRLSRCDFPFQCAHGRPSLVPLLKFEISPQFKNTIAVRASMADCTLH